MSDKFSPMYGCIFDNDNSFKPFYGCIAIDDNSNSSKLNCNDTKRHRVLSLLQELYKEVKDWVPNKDDSVGDGDVLELECYIDDFIKLMSGAQTKHDDYCVNATLEIGDHKTSVFYQATVWSKSGECSLMYKQNFITEDKAISWAKIYAKEYPDVKVRVDEITESSEKKENNNIIFYKGNTVYVVMSTTGASKPNKF